ncbi:MAG: hypothetical protein ABMA26_23520 [Limisphaerales bacterium]
MADHYTNFSFQVRLPDVAAQAYALQLAATVSRLNLGDAADADLPEALRAPAVIEDWCFEVEADTVEQQPGLWLHSSEGGIDAACAFVQHLLQTYDPAGRVTFQWAYDCTRPCLDAYGGGAALITATEIKAMSTHQWLQAQAA